MNAMDRIVGDDYRPALIRLSKTAEAIAMRQCDSFWIPLQAAKYNLNYERQSDATKILTSGKEFVLQ